MTPEELTRLKEICEKASPGPWDINPKYSNYATAVVIETSRLGVATCYSTEDTRFIAEARTALPKLIEEVERLSSLQEELANDLHDSRYRVTILNIENARLNEVLRNLVSKSSYMGGLQCEDWDKAREALGGGG